MIISALETKVNSNFFKKGQFCFKLRVEILKLLMFRLLTTRFLKSISEGTRRRSKHLGGGGDILSGKGYRD